ncbi:hypothetical protein Acor_26980 [Acrocarpospora corrugata]|uniref:HTH arsR-type domain-containing protein n=1 Tax=Acrocarpospora corrugata TaxID=35763 RepID=A0A5M3VVV4_9ACTN|nr:metalloregulator ArsR/SmtB family transcription factor [Acrocarpospora corrugata]GES00634.1 hypothetical protein Acor_26980 [Acrocarpospora corrugata]
MDQLDATFAALADPTRRAILARLAAGEATVTELAAPFAMSQPAISKHLKVLERAGLISRGRDAQRRPCRLEGRRLRVATDWLADFHCGDAGDSGQHCDGGPEDAGQGVRGRDDELGGRPGGPGREERRG